MDGQPQGPDFRGLPVASLIHIGTECAFHGAPADGVAPLTIAIEQSTDLDDHSHARWLLGVCLASSGDFERARDVLVPLTNSPPTPRRWASLAHTTIASTLRQEGKHPAAQQQDELALELSVESTQFDAHIGLAADAVGQLDVASARCELAAARAVATIEWRQQVRVAWVDAEIALMEDRPADALSIALAAAAIAERSDAPRHQAKSLLFAGVAARGAGDDTHAIELLEDAVALSERLGLESLLRVARAVLAGRA